MELKSTQLNKGCYHSMFKGCTSITDYPKLPATVLKEECYAYMFEGCINAGHTETIVSYSNIKLPGKILVYKCYERMFDGCSYMNFMNASASDISATDSTSYWMSNVASTGTFVQSIDRPGWLVDNPSGIPIGWTPKTQVPFGPDDIKSTLCIAYWDSSKDVPAVGGRASYTNCTGMKFIITTTDGTIYDMTSDTTFLGYIDVARSESVVRHVCGGVPISAVCSFINEEGSYVVNGSCVVTSYQAPFEIIDNSSVDFDGDPITSGPETSNCYRVTEPGTFAFPLVYGDGIKDGEPNPDAYTNTDPDSPNTSDFVNYLGNPISSPYIETDTGKRADRVEVLWNDSADLVIENIGLVDGYPYRKVRYDVTSVPENGGNALIGLFDEDGKIMWSWHVWAYPKTITNTEWTNASGNKYELMGVSLGWVSDPSNPKYGTAPYFQWGRRDPMIRAAASDSDTDVTLAVGNFYKSTTPASGAAEAIQNPNKFFGGSRDWVSSGNHYNWWDSANKTPYSSDRDVVKTIYDPCPTGYTVPHGNVFSGMVRPLGATFDRGYIFGGRYFAADGNRDMDSGNIKTSSPGAEGQYHMSSVIDGENVNALQFDATASGVVGTIPPASGAVIIPVKEHRTVVSDMSKLDPSSDSGHTNPSTANCYVIKEPGTYKFPAVYGNAIKNGVINTPAFTKNSSSNSTDFYNYKNEVITSPFINIDTNETISSAEILLNDSGLNITDITITSGSIAGQTCPFIQFTVNNIPSTGGNIILGIKDSSGNVMWSWHLWGYPDGVGSVEHTTSSGETIRMMNVNLGWVKDSATGKYGTAPYYQWGRKDPMLRALRYNSSTRASASQGDWTIGSYAASISDAIKNPTKFFTQNSNGYWWNQSSASVNMWDASETETISTSTKSQVIKTIYDPCPIGFMVPRISTFSGITRTAGGTWDYGYTWDGRYFPALGALSETTSNPGEIQGISITALYWTGLPHSDLASTFVSTESSVSTNTYSCKAQGQPILPIVDELAFTTDLSYYDVNGDVLSGGRETANCYVIKNTGSYSFPLIYGAAIKNGVVNPSAYTEKVQDSKKGEPNATYPFINYTDTTVSDAFIEKDTGKTASRVKLLWGDTTDFVIDDIRLVSGEDCRYVSFKVTKVPTNGGNICLAVYDDTNTIMWSWHLWAYPFKLTTKAITNSIGYTWNVLDVDLGWKKQSVDSKYGTAAYYQHGRKDILGFATAYNNTALITPPQGSGSWSFSGYTTSPAMGIKNPMIHYGAVDNSWWQGTPKTGYSTTNGNNYWDADNIINANKRRASWNTVPCKTIYDPCPAGYTVPSSGLFDTSVLTKDTGGTWDYGYTWFGRYFPSAGHISDTSQSPMDSNPAYIRSWAAQRNPMCQNTAATIYFECINGGINVSEKSTANAFHITPVKDTIGYPSNDMSSVDVNGNPLSGRETANCYVIHGTGTYQYPLIYAAAIRDGKVNPSAYTQVDTSGGNTQPFYTFNPDATNNKNIITSPYIEQEFGGGQCAKTVEVSWITPGFEINSTSIISDFPARLVRFTVKKFPSDGGNAVITIRDANSNIIHSIHVWAYPGDITDINIKGGKIGESGSVMNVNLGSRYATGSDVPVAPYFQWGRSMPVPPRKSVTEDIMDTVTVMGYKTAIEVSATPAVLTEGALPAEGNTTFYQNKSSRNNWCTLTSGSTTGVLINFFNWWNSANHTSGTDVSPVEKTVYDPCPVGYTVPNTDTFSGCTKETAGTWNYGFTWGGRHFPALGVLNKPNPTGAWPDADESENGYYWGTGSVDENGASIALYESYESNGGSGSVITFSSSSEQTVSFTDAVGTGAYASFDISDDGTTWTVWDKTAHTFNGDVYIRGRNPKGLGNADIEDTSKGARFSFGNSGVPVTVSGNIMSLLDYTKDLTEFPENNAFAGLFYDAVALSDASGLELPSYTGQNCYASMFRGCTSLTTGPELPALVLTASCYSGMFMDCESLTTHPDLPATSLAESCYSGMFWGCKSLTTTPDLPATSLEKFCYAYMFYYCNSITSAPVLAAPCLVRMCYYQMFYDCSNLNTIKCLATSGIGSGNATMEWLFGVAGSGTFTKAAGASWSTGYDGIPSGWTTVEE